LWSAGVQGAPMCSAFVCAGVRYQKYLGVGPRTFLVTSCGVAGFWIAQEKSMLHFMDEQGHIDVAGAKPEVKRATDW
jgi:hypothetical protein